MSKIISIQNSGESFEKCLALFYTARKSDVSFYSNNGFYIYYGHNLPKKDITISSHGTVGFYEKYFSKYDWCPISRIQDLLLMKERLLRLLNENGFISKRSRDYLYNNELLYIEFILKMPMEILFPDMFLKIREKVKDIFPNAKFDKIYLEKNYMQYFSSLPSERWAYSVYALNINGTIGRYYFSGLGNEEYYYRNLFHMFKDLSQKPILSGNSALFLAEIQDTTRNMRCAIGYREHNREKRHTRDFALQEILKEKSAIIEPRNTEFSKYFDTISDKERYSMEELANMVIARV